MIGYLRRGVLTFAIIGIVGTVGFAGGTTEPGPDGNAGTYAAGIRAVPLPDTVRTAVFAGGCFWCMEEAFEKVPGVADAVSGYAGGITENPTYYEVASGTTGHAEVVEVIYDPAVVTYEELLAVFWRNVDLVDGGGQFCDRGTSYRTGVFYSSEEQRIAAETSRREIEESGRFGLPVATEITPLETFYPAEEYHQDYYRKDPIRYQFYKSACGRERRLEQLWGEEAGGPVQDQ